jgi:hypothetical protein
MEIVNNIERRVEKAIVTARLANLGWRKPPHGPWGGPATKKKKKKSLARGVFVYFFFIILIFNYFFVSFLLRRQLTHL